MLFSSVLFGQFRLWKYKFWRVVVTATIAVGYFHFSTPLILQFLIILMTFLMVFQLFRCLILIFNCLHALPIYLPLSLSISFPISFICSFLLSFWYTVIVCKNRSKSNGLSSTLSTPHPMKYDTSAGRPVVSTVQCSAVQYVRIGCGSVNVGMVIHVYEKWWSVKWCNSTTQCNTINCDMVWQDITW